MKIVIICSSHDHPIYPRLAAWAMVQRDRHEVRLVARADDLANDNGDILFLISCHEIIPAEVRQRYKAALVIHASDLPQGRGWSPWVWQILEGKNTVTVTLLTAEDKVDSGAVWHKIKLQFAGHELSDEIQNALFEATLALMNFAIDNFGKIKPVPQGGEPSYYPRRTPEDSRLDVHRSIAEQFDLLRVCDPVRYPAFFDYRGHRYQLLIKKAKQE